MKRKLTTGAILMCSLFVVVSQTQYAFTELAAGLKSPLSPQVDAHGQIYFAELLGNIKRLSLDGQVHAFAPTFTFGVAVAVDKNTNIFIGDIEDRRIYRIDPAENVTTVVRNVNAPQLTWDASGNLWTAIDRSRIFRIGSGGETNVIAGTSTRLHRDGFVPLAAFANATGIAVDANTNAFVVDGNCIRKVAFVDTNWLVSTIAGAPFEAGANDGVGSAARFNRPHGIAVDGDGNIYVGDDFNHTIRKLTPAGTNWVVRTIAGKAQESGNALGLGSATRLSHPMTLTVDNTGRLIVADKGNGRLITGFPTHIPVELEFLPGLGRPRFSGGKLEALLVCPTNVNVVVEFTTDLSQWTPIQTNAIPATGLLELSLMQVSEGRAFYRARRAD